MIEEIIREHLLNRLDCPVWLEMPKNPPERFVLLERTSGGEENWVKYPTVAVQSYGASLYEAAGLNEAVKAAMKELVERDEVSSVSLNSDYNFTDTTNHRYRYQAVFDLVHY